MKMSGISVIQESVQEAAKGIADIRSTIATLMIRNDWTESTRESTHFGVESNQFMARQGNRDIGVCVLIDTQIELTR
jgi:uncharacterized 2Fe-2S/4Fe-4S cluster protein (DUF4445 family)